METTISTNTPTGLTGPSGRGRLQPVLEHTDSRILNLLQENAELPVNHLATKVYKSPGATQERIRKYLAVLDRRRACGPALVVAMVRLSRHATAVLEAFAAEMNRWPEIQYCLHVSGEFDFVLHVSLRDAQEYGDFLNRKLCGLEVVERVQSSIVLKECKSMTALPL